MEQWSSGDWHTHVACWQGKVYLSRETGTFWRGSGMPSTLASSTLISKAPYSSMPFTIKASFLRTCSSSSNNNHAGLSGRQPFPFAFSSNTALTHLFECFKGRHVTSVSCQGTGSSQHNFTAAFSGQAGCNLSKRVRGICSAAERIEMKACKHDSADRLPAVLLHLGGDELQLLRSPRSASPATACGAWHGLRPALAPARH